MTEGTIAKGKIRKETNNNIQNITHKSKDRVSHTTNETSWQEEEDSWYTCVCQLSTKHSTYIVNPKPNI
jgi:hypothetical protein